MEDLSRLPNIGKPLEEKLILLGITSPRDLTYLGSKEAYLRMKLIFPQDAGIMLLFALEGAIRDMRWPMLNKDIKSDLSKFYRLFK